MNNEDFFKQVERKKIRRSDWCAEEYFIPYKLVFHKDPYDSKEKYFMLGQYFLNDIEFIMCELDIETGFTPDKYGIVWELYTGEAHYDYSQTH